MTLTVELVPDNLKKLCNLISDANSRWFELGFQLDIKLTELEVIKSENTTTNKCFWKMLSTWLNMIDPQPSWNRLLAALEHDSVRCGHLAKQIRKRFDLPNQPTDTSTSLKLSPPPKNVPSAMPST